MKPLLIYDGDCGFCKRWIARWELMTQEHVEYAPYQEVETRFPEIPTEKFKTSVQLIEPSGKISEGAEAVFRTLAYVPRKKWMLMCYEHIPGVRLLSEMGYRLIAKNRRFFSALTDFLWGNTLEPSTHTVSSALFLHGLGMIYLIAFVSFWIQMKGLIGSHGILPVPGTLETVRNQLGAQGYFWFPTLCWLNSGDWFLHFLCGAGVLLSVTVMVCAFPVLGFFLLWLIYLSLVVVSREFLAFQWDALLLETGFLAIFFVPLKIFPTYDDLSKSSKKLLFLLKWLLFRLIVSSGICKWTSSDPTWKHLTALTFHYETQPLPTWTSWYVHQCPVWFHQMSCGIMFAIELAVPFLFFAPRRFRHFAAISAIFLQILIMATGNYCFFNLLTILLCVLLFDDRLLAKIGFRRKLKDPFALHAGSGKWPKWVLRPVLAVVFIISLVPISARVGWSGYLPAVIRQVYAFSSPFNLVSNYGLFAMMTTERPEIIVEGSRDGKSWLPYEFKYKPGDLNRRPRFVAPHQPRLDWQMWFAALGSYRQNPWFVNFCIRLLEGSKDVLKLIENNPFPDAPPKYIRAVVYQYHFTDVKTKKRDGTWWRREFQGLYCPTMSIQ